MEINSSFNEDCDFVLELLDENDCGVDENDNYKHVEQTKIQQPAELDIIEQSSDKIDLEFTKDNEISNNHNRISRKRQTKLFEYFSASPTTEKSSVELFERDGALDKMVDVSLLMSQLLNARIVLERLLPEKLVIQPECKKSKLFVNKRIRVQRYCYKCKTLNVDHKNVTKAKSCSKCGTHLLYVCEKCNEKIYYCYKNFWRHKNRCNGNKTGKSLKDVALFLCANCPYKTSYKIYIEQHLKSTGHQVLDGKRPRKSVNYQASTFKSGIQLYCLKCKTLNVDHTCTRKKNFCSKCSSMLFFVCHKCNVNHFHNYNNMMKHKRRCKGEQTGKSLKDVSFMYCAHCPFKTSSRLFMKNHVHMHRNILGASTERSEKSSKEVQNYEYQLQYLVNKCNVDYSKARKRFCPTCIQRVVNSNTKDDQTCSVCKTILLYQCDKCSKQFSTYKTIQYHIKTKCYPSLYRCTNCKFTSPIWDTISQHLKRRCDLPRTYEGKQFMCKHCLVGYNHKQSLTRHLKMKHKDMFD